MKTTAWIEMGKDGTFGIYTPDIESTIIGEGATVEEAKADFENSVSEVLECYNETGKPLPEELRDVEFEYKYDLPSFLSYYKILNMSKFAEYAKINPSLMRQYKSGQYISAGQRKKIQTAIHKIGRELASVNLL